MGKLLSVHTKIRGALDKVVSIERYICAVFLVIMTLITFIQVIFRFVFRAPFSWAEEVTLMFLVWFGYLCMPIDIYTDEHAAIFAFYNKIPAVGKKILDFVRHGLLLWFFIELTHYGYLLYKINIKKVQAATGMSYGWLYFPLVVGGVIMSIYCISNFFKTLCTPVSEYRKLDSDEETLEDKVKEKGGVL